jgi:DNA-directed RNA polymerase specialized sigma24 family protein
VKSAVVAHSRYALIDALNAEWDNLDRDRLFAPQCRSVITRWAGEHDVLRDCRTTADVLHAIRSDPDPVLAVLIGIHQAQRTTSAVSGDHLAGRILLQTMLGKIVTMAARDSRHGVEEYVGQLWARIAGYPLARRPRRIAANLALDTLKAVIREMTTAEPIHAVPVTPGELELAGLANGVWEPAGDSTQDARAVGDPVAALSARRVLRTAQNLSLIDEPTRRLLISVYTEGLSSAAAAERHGLTPATVRFRCSKAIRRMAHYRLLIADAA